ncbi:UvrD-helicase domain-containing protein [Flavihumibacter sp. CACIAM 22H1]|uniref:UvrD-helicase domain-containing protein n=1 Tax=Flavihumibacter sp. CACIAM 22H1 TaxID=1812911 RepID=UPI000AC02160|nr:UvrD-helicase domain-containing protein [Flavihumibacter sp. CACIAM 22H1]
MLPTKPLHIYRASAGSGKTFLLASEYLCLVFEYPHKYREILAVTFTNKATEEMKERILGELKKIALGYPTPYAAILQERNPSLKDAATLQAAADKIYRRILHDYAKFSVNTIDSFVQQVIRSFAFEIGLDAGFELQLNQDTVKEELADRLFELLETNQVLLNWVKNIALERIEAGQNWDFRAELLSLAGEIFQERFYRFEQNMRQLEDPAPAFDAIKKNRQQQQKQVELNMQEWAEKALDVLKTAGLHFTDFSRGEKGFINYFNKIQRKDFAPTKTVLEALDNLPKWTAAKTDPATKDRVEQAYPELNTYLRQAIDFYKEHELMYQTSVAVLRKLNNLSLLRILAEQLSEYRRDNNVLLISDTQQLLRELVKDNEAPFIYEKIGNRYQHFLLDEFQDTSRFQWENFKPLIEQSVAVGDFNLIVGDVKQSIYRWRNGDWRLLQSQVKQDIGKELVYEASLQENYRSRAAIIDFNNTLFGTIPALLQQDFIREMSEVNDEQMLKKLQGNRYFSIIEEAYQDAIQEKPATCKPGGAVDIRFYEKEEARAASSWKPAAESRLCALVDELLIDQQVKPGQLTILTRNNADARRVISLLLEYKQSSVARARDYNLISSDALLISASPAIQLIIAAFRFLLNEKDDIARVELIQSNALRLGMDISQPSLYRKEINHQLALLPAAFAKEKPLLLQLSLYEATELLISQFQLDEWASEQAYVLAFRDLVNSFSSKGKPSVRDFISWWQEEGETKALPLASGDNAIQVMTIHKSKGLAFDIVILPYADWKLKSDKGLLWCDWNQDDAGLEVLPVDINSSLGKTVFAYEYFEEMLMSRMDALNLLYVALTRARQGIYMMAPLPSRSVEEKGMSTIADLLYQGVQQQNPFLVEGSLESAGAVPDRANELQIPLQSPLGFHVKAIREPGKTAQVLQAGYSDKQKIGQLAHLALSRINGQAELENCLKRMQLEGILTGMQWQAVKEFVLQALQHPQLSSWFSGSYKMLSEKAILLPGGSIRRPDKILVGEKETILLDFKFTQEAASAHGKQLKQYKDLLQQMGYPSIQAFIYYGYNQSLVPLHALAGHQGNLFG